MEEILKRPRGVPTPYQNPIVRVLLWIWALLLALFILLREFIDSMFSSARGNGDNGGGGSGKRKDGKGNRVKYFKPSCGPSS